MDETNLRGTNLYYYRARYYSPSLGRFLQTDPVGSKDDLNPYAFARNDAFNRIDPNGMASCPEKCPDIPLPPESDRQKLIDHLGGSDSGKERGAQLYENEETGEQRIGTKGVATDTEFEHHVVREPGEKLVLLGHVHKNPSDQRTIGVTNDRKDNNAPSKDDVAGMETSNHGKGTAVLTIGPDVTSTLYRVDGQKRLRIESGDRTKLPNLEPEGIIVDPEIED